MAQFPNKISVLSRLAGALFSNPEHRIQQLNNRDKN